MARVVALIGSLALICLVAALTISVAVDEGVDILVIVSLVVIALLGFGVLGALASPPPDD
jgi:hypothetical protein